MLLKAVAVKVIVNLLELIVQHHVELLLSLIDNIIKLVFEGGDLSLVFVNLLVLCQLYVLLDAGDFALKALDALVEGSGSVGGSVIDVIASHVAVLTVEAADATTIHIGAGVPVVSREAGVGVLLVARVHILQRSLKPRFEV